MHAFGILLSMEYASFEDLMKKHGVKMAKNKKYPDRAADVSVTQKMLYGIRDELKSLLRSQSRKIDSKFLKVDGQFEELKSEMYRLGVVIEEQNSKNNVALDGLADLLPRQKKIESSQETISEMIDRLEAQSKVLNFKYDDLKRRIQKS